MALSKGSLSGGSFGGGIKLFTGGGSRRLPVATFTLCSISLCACIYVGFSLCTEELGSEAVSSRPSLKKSKKRRPPPRTPLYSWASRSDGVPWSLLYALD